MISPTLINKIVSLVKSKKVLSFKLLHSFDDKLSFLEKYINNFNINYYEIIKDAELLGKYLIRIEKLYKRKLSF